MQIHFWTKDMDAAMTFYSNVLGFSISYAQPDEKPHDFCIMELNGQVVMFGEPPTKLVTQERNDVPLLRTVLSRVGEPGSLSIYLAVPDVEAHYERAKANGATILEPLWQPPWGAPQYSLSDMDGHLLTFHAEET